MCLDTRENILNFFLQKQPVPFQAHAFPLPPYFATRVDYLCSVLETLASAKMQAKMTMNLDAYKKYCNLVSLSTKRNALTKRLSEIEQELDNKKGTQRTTAQFVSGERSFTGTTSSKGSIQLESPSETNELHCSTCNCCIKPLPNSVVGKEVAVEVLPSFLAYYWVAQVWLEYNGATFFAKEISALEQEYHESKVDLLSIQAELCDLEEELKKKEDYFGTITESVKDIYSALAVLQRKAFQLAEFDILREFCGTENNTPSLEELAERLPSFLNAISPVKPSSSVIVPAQPEEIELSRVQLPSTLCCKVKEISLFVSSKILVGVF